MSATELTDNNATMTLHTVAFNGDTENCKRLLDHGADVNAKNNKYDETPLHWAAMRGQTEICNLLRQYGAK